MISRSGLFGTCLTAAVFAANAGTSLVYAEGAAKPNGILLAAGDIAQCGDDPYRQQATADLIKKEIDDPANAGVPIRVLALGDLAYPSGRKQDFECFDQSWGKIVKDMLPVPGNHEYEKDATPYFDYFNTHNKTVVSENGPKAGYYSLNFPKPEEAVNKDARAWHLIALNSASDGVDADADQLKWLRDDLAANSQRCVLAFAHYFLFSSGRHGHEPPNYGKKTKEGNLKKAPVPYNGMRKTFGMLHASGVSLLLSGHDHQYEEFKPQDADRHAVPNGVRSFIVGTGGASFYSEAYQQIWPNSEPGRRQARWHGLLKLELFDDRYRWRFVPVTGANNVPADFTAPREEKCNPRAGPA